MHELGIARDIMRTAVQHAEGRRILSVTVEVGPLAGVSVDALDFCVVETAKEMELGEPQVTIRAVPVVFECSCGRQYEATDPLEACPACGGHDRKILSGMDVVIKEIELEETK